MKKTLVIHLQDKTTDFLKIIYENHLKDWTIVNDGNIKEEELIKLIKSHDRIIMMGHGVPSGLINPQKFGLIINYKHADLLRDKETISIWCNSDKYFKNYNIKGFHTGMIISEVAEASYVLGETPLNEEETLNNMVAFATIIKQCIDKTPHEMQDYILKNYTFKDKVTEYNRKNIIVLD